MSKDVFSWSTTYVKARYNAKKVVARVSDRDGLVVFVKQGYNLTQGNVLIVQNGSTKSSDVKGNLEKVKTMFVCRRCMRSMKNDDLVEKSVVIGEGVELEKVTKFCYFGDMLDADGGKESAVTTSVRCAWNKFRELRPFLTAKRVSLQVKGKVYESCVRSCMTYGSETWPLHRCIRQAMHTCIDIPRYGNPTDTLTTAGGVMP
jgi:hypothetical protein